jgi:hypothetical protein
MDDSSLSVAFSATMMSTVSENFLDNYNFAMMSRSITLSIRVMTISMTNVMSVMMNSFVMMTFAYYFDTFIQFGSSQYRSYQNQEKSKLSFHF